MSEVTVDRIDLSGIRGSLAARTLAGFGLADDGVDLRKASAPKISKVPGVIAAAGSGVEIRKRSTPKVSKLPN